MGLNDIDAEDQSHDGTGINQQMDNLVEGQCLNLPSEAKADGTVKHKQRKAFFDRVDELKAFKEKHGHLKFHQKDDASLYEFCRNLKRSRSALLTGKGKINNSLDDDRIAALDAIGFNWNPGASSTAASQDDKFFDRVEKLRAYKEKHGHLNVRKKEDKSLYEFCRTLMYARKGKGSYRLNDGRIAALDAIGFEWEDGVPKVDKAKKKDFFIRVDELKAYKEKHGHLKVREKDDSSLYNFCYNMRQARRDMISGKGTRRKLTEDRIAALDAIGFDWEVGASSSVYKDFFSRVDELRVYKEKHGHLNIRQKEDRSLYGFCVNVRKARAASKDNNLRKARKGKGTYRLDETRIAALDAIGFNWEAGGPSSVAAKAVFFRLS
jgi:hypothetical protein